MPDLPESIPQFEQPRPWWTYQNLLPYVLAPTRRTRVTIRLIRVSNTDALPAWAGSSAGSQWAFGFTVHGHATPLGSLANPIYLPEGDDHFPDLLLFDDVVGICDEASTLDFVINAVEIDTGGQNESAKLAFPKSFKSPSQSLWTKSVVLYEQETETLARESDPKVRFPGKRQSRIVFAFETVALCV